MGQLGSDFNADFEEGHGPDRKEPHSKSSVRHLPSCVAQCGKLTKRRQECLPTIASRCTVYQNVGTHGSSKNKCKIGPGLFKTCPEEAQTIQNRGLEVQKSSPEPSKMQFYKTFNLRRLKMTTVVNLLTPK